MHRNREINKPYKISYGLMMMLMMMVMMMLLVWVLLLLVMILMMMMMMMMMMMTCRLIHSPTAQVTSTYACLTIQPQHSKGRRRLDSAAGKAKTLLRNKQHQTWNNLHAQTQLTCVYTLSAITFTCFGVLPKCRLLKRMWCCMVHIWSYMYGSCIIICGPCTIIYCPCMII